MTNTEKLKDILGSYKLGVDTLDFTISRIIEVYKTSERFNIFNFIIGTLTGMAAMWIIFKLYGVI